MSTMQTRKSKAPYSYRLAPVASCALYGNVVPAVGNMQVPVTLVSPPSLGLGVWRDHTNGSFSRVLAMTLLVYA